MNKFRKNWKSIPNSALQKLSCIKKAINGSESKINFGYLNDEEYYSRPDRGIGMEWEFGLKPRPSKESVKYLTDNEISGKIMGPSRFKEQHKFYDLSKPVYFPSEAYNLFLEAIAPNLTDLIYQQPHNDTTVSGGSGGAEVVFMPLSQMAVEYLRIDCNRIAYHAQKLGGYIPEDSSEHFHISTELFGETKEEFSNTFLDFIVFLFENRNFILRISDRIGAGEDLANFNYYLDDMFEEKTTEALKRTLYIRKSIMKGLLEELGYISATEKGGIANSDDRVKGWANMVVNDEHHTVEFRWFGSSFSGEKKAAKIQFLYALLEFLKIDRTGSKEDEFSLRRFCEYLDHKFDTDELALYKYGHLYNRLIQDEEAVDYLKETTEKSVPVYTEEEILDFSAYEVAEKYFQEKTIPKETFFREAISNEENKKNSFKDLSDLSMLLPKINDEAIDADISGNIEDMPMDTIPDTNSILGIPVGDDTVDTKELKILIEKDEEENDEEDEEYDDDDDELYCQECEECGEHEDSLDASSIIKKWYVKMLYKDHTDGENTFDYETCKYCEKSKKEEILEDEEYSEVLFWDDGEDEPEFKTLKLPEAECHRCDAVIIARECFNYKGEDTCDTCADILESMTGKKLPKKTIHAKASV